MKRILIYIVVVAAAMLVPIERTDVGELQPVELIHMYREGKQIVLGTDTEDSGHGATVEEAFRNLEDTTPGIIFLDTADYLMVSENAEDLIGELRSYLKPCVRVCVAEKGIKLAEAAEYLAIHSPKATIGEVKKESDMEVLVLQNGRLNLFEKK